eukprot:scaffold13628_cov31-Tisochrysis_lutea.AAC.2
MSRRSHESSRQCPPRGAGGHPTPQGSVGLEGQRTRRLHTAGAVAAPGGCTRQRRRHAGTWDASR